MLKSGLLSLRTEKMVANLGDNSSGANPLVGCLIRIIVIECTAGRIGAIESLTSCAACRVGDSFVDLSIGNGGEGARLIDNTGDAVREGGGLHAVEDNCADCYLTDIGFSAGFGGDDAGEQFKVGVGNRRG